MKKRILSILMVVCMVVGLMPTTGLAAETTGAFGAFNVSYDGTTPTYASNTLTIGSGNYTIGGTTNVDKILVSSGANANITINNVTIDVSGTLDACAFDMSGAVVNLILSGTNTLKSGGKKAGLQVPGGAQLDIGGTGILFATGGDRGAGIGGGYGVSAGTITIASGTINASGGGSDANSGAGIGGGGGDFNAPVGNGGTIIINGGTVTARGIQKSAGIGGGGANGSPLQPGGGGVVTINAGTVLAYGGNYGAGIGGGGGDGSCGNGATVKINGGSVKATGGGNAAAIGAGGYTGNFYGFKNNGSLTNYRNWAIELYTLTLSEGGVDTAFIGLNTSPALGSDYSTHDMRIDENDKLYVYLPSGDRSDAILSLTTENGTYDGSITDKTANLTYTPGFPVSGTVSAGTTGIGISGLAVNLYSTTDTTFSTSLGSAITDESGRYTISGLTNGSYVVRIEGISGSFAGSKSNTIAVNSAAVNNVDITLAALTTQSIAVKSGSHKTAYHVGDLLDVTNLKITVTRSDGSVYDKEVTAGMITGFNSSAVAESQNLIINFEGKKTTYNVSVSRLVYSGSPATSPGIISKTDTGVVLNPVAVVDQTIEYGKSTTNTTPNAWQDSTIFSDLTANTTYYFFARIKQTSVVEAGGLSPVLTVTTKGAAPAAPTLSFSSVSSDRVAITAVMGAQYSKDNGGNWQDGNVFEGLSASTQYTFAIRIKETDDTVAGTKTSLAQYTAAAKPSEGTGYSVNYTTEIITIESEFEVNTSAEFGAGTSVENDELLTAGTLYYVRIKAVTGGAPASEAASFTIAPRPAAPTTITAIKTKDGITITSVSGQEYKIGDGAWQDGGSFAGLSPNTDYTVFARVKAVSSGSPSFASEEFSATIKTKSDGNSGFTMPTISVSPTYSLGKTLNEIPLPLGWAWVAPTTIPAVAITSYSAVYTPADTETVDYSDVTGYEVDGSGKVTINRLIPLTVNRAIPTAADFDFIQPASLDYSGTIKTAAVTAKTGISGMGTVTVVYNPGETTASPVNAGTYTVKIDIAQGDNYGAATGVADEAWKFSIAKVTQAALNVTNIPAIVTYGDSFTLGTTGGSGTGEVTWAVTEGESATVDASGNVTTTGIGTTTLTATKSADGNHLADVAATYTFTPVTLPLIVDDPLAAGGWAKTYDGSTDFDPSRITVGAITNKVGSDDVIVSVQSATYDTTDIGAGNKKLTITYAIGGENSGTYSAPGNYVVNTASITAATPTITLANKTAVYGDKIIGIDEATVTGVPGGTTPDGVIAYTYYTKETCADADKTTVDKNGAEVIGGAPKSAGTYYVKAMIAASGNYSAATSGAVTLTIYYPSSGQSASTPVIVDGKAVDMGTTEVKEGTTTIKVDQDKMREQLKSAKDSVVIPIAATTGTASAQLVVQNVENMAERRMILIVKVNEVSYEIPTGSVDTAAILKNLGAPDSSKVPLNITISRLSQKSVTVKEGTLITGPVAFTITAAYNGKSIEVDRFESYVQRVIEIPGGVDPKTITTAVVVEKNGVQRHVPTDVYSKGGKWYAKINSLTNSTYALIHSNASFADTTGKWYAAIATEMASRKILSGVGENKFAGDRSITRAEFAAILVHALGLPAEGKSAFGDVSSSAWYSGAVATAAEYGVVTGKGDNKFAPNANITRQEAMTMLQRAAELADYPGSDGSLGKFTDAGSVSKWAQGAATWNVGSGLIVGSGGLIRPNDNITRAESGAVILRLLQKAGLVDVRS